MVGFPCGAVICSTQMRKPCQSYYVVENNKKKMNSAFVAEPFWARLAETAAMSAPRVDKVSGYGQLVR